MTRYIYSLVSVFCFRHFSVKQLKFEIYIIVLSGEINISDSNFLSSSYGNESQKSVGYENIPRWYGPFLGSDWLKTKGSGRVMG